MTDPVFRYHASEIAKILHAGQVDKSGEPYIDHPEGVATLVVKNYLDHPDFGILLAAAWLHDVLEDTAMTAAGLLELGVDPAAIEVVELLTHKRGEVLEDYYRAIAAHPLARLVKILDVYHNLSRNHLLTDPATAKRLRDKYAHALTILDPFGTMEIRMH
jgi:(p)ppGpp synthase/HD superfamily hydrolase